MPAFELLERSTVPAFECFHVVVGQRDTVTAFHSWVLRRLIVERLILNAFKRAKRVLYAFFPITLFISIV